MGGKTLPADWPKCKAGQPLAKRKLTPEQLAAVKDLAKGWGKILAHNAYGESRPGQVLAVVGVPRVTSIHDEPGRPETF